MTILGRSWHEDFAQLLRSAEERVVLISPYVTDVGTEFVARNLRRDSRKPVKVLLYTNLTPSNVSQGATNPNAITLLASAGFDLEVTHLPQLHAKVYIADASAAFVTSANLTAGGLYRNREAGVGIKDAHLIETLTHEFIDYGTLGVRLQRQDLALLCQVSASLRAIREESRNHPAERELRERVEAVLTTAQDELIRLKLAGGTVTKTFEKTILYLLRRHGPLATKELHPMVRDIHPDLCDDTVDRVIAGERFGKKWKHSVRSAQQHLKAAGLIGLKKGAWQCAEK